MEGYEIKKIFFALALIGSFGKAEIDVCLGAKTYYNNNLGSISDTKEVSKDHKKYIYGLSFSRNAKYHIPMIDNLGFVGVDGNGISSRGNRISIATKSFFYAVSKHNNKNVDVLLKELDELDNIANMELKILDVCGMSDIKNKIKKDIETRRIFKDKIRAAAARDKSDYDIDMEKKSASEQAFKDMMGLK